MARSGIERRPPGLVRRLAVDLDPLRSSRDFRLLWLGELFKVLGFARGAAFDAIGFASGDRTHTL